MAALGAPVLMMPSSADAQSSGTGVETGGQEIGSSQTAAPVGQVAAAPQQTAPPAEAPTGGLAPRASSDDRTASSAAEREPPPLDPLTPPRVEPPPAVAPAPVMSGPNPPSAEPRDAAPAAATAATAGERGQASAAVTEALGAVRQLLADTSATRGAAPDDRAALVAFYADRGELVWTGTDGLSRRGAAVVAEMARAADWGLDPAAFDAPTLAANASAQEIAAAEARIAVAVLRYARHARGGRLPDPSIVSKTIDMKPRFFAPRTVLDAIAVTGDAGVYLTGLHPQHAGFKRLQKALVALRAGTLPAPTPAAEPPTESSDGKRVKKGKAQAEKAPRTYSRTEKETRLVVNMERWRWMPDDLGAVHVMNNVPEQVTRTYRDGSPIFTERIVVGKPTTPTPVFSADMRFVIFHPTWGVPDGIKSNELGPALRRASASSSNWLFGGGGDGASRVLERHNLRVYSGGREINPNSVDWTSVDPRRFTFVQPPGGKNVLGVVKFRFPNRHDVYMHDTQDKQLFSHSVRAYSHGCMRVQNPIRFAEVLLAQDKGWTSDRVQSQLGRSGPIDITLDRPIPVHSVYFTATADDSGGLKLHGDLYGMDGRLASALAGRQVHLAAASAPAEVPKRESRRGGGSSPVAATGGASSGGASAGASYNPFSGLTGN